MRNSSAVKIHMGGLRPKYLKYATDPEWYCRVTGSHAKTACRWPVKA